ncbi:MAG TPA: hypothetical protein VJX47_04835 [Candidatus Sulfotelmatobacter sp.]|nr:hypothetical protein [Candidatus Sulfotelmatobacter sp.]
MAKAKAETDRRAEHKRKVLEITEQEAIAIKEIKQAEFNNQAKAVIGAVDEPTEEQQTVVTEFPDDCMYGEAKVLAKQLKVPHGLGYPALIGCYSIRPEANVVCGTLLTMDVALCAPVGGGKNVAMDRAARLLDLTKDTEYKKAAPAGVRGLFTLIGDKPSGKPKDKTRIPGPKKLLLLTHEMTDVLKMTGLENSTLASRLCDLWDDPEFDYPTKEGIIGVNCRLSWIGGVPCSVENPVRFTELFDSETSHGLYDRLILGYSDVKFNYKHWSPPKGPAIDFSDYSAEMPPHVESVDSAAQALYDAWEPNDDGARTKQNCMKVALITTMMNHESRVSTECMAKAIRFMQWQIELKKVFEPGNALNDAARLRTIILHAMKRKGADTKYINLKRLAHDSKWAFRFSDWLVLSVITNLESMGEIIAKPEETYDKQGNVVDVKKSKNMFMLRDFSK